MSSVVPATTTEDEPAPKRTSKTPAIPSEIPTDEDRFAPAPSGCECVDRNGYKRRRHELDGDGHCFFCFPPREEARR